MKLFNRIICFFIGHKPYRVKWTNSFYIKMNRKGGQRRNKHIHRFNSNERIKTYSCTHFHCKLRCLDIENGVIHFTTALNEILVTKNIKEFYVNDMCIDINTNTIQNTESLNVKNC